MSNVSQKLATLSADPSGTIRRKYNAYRRSLLAKRAKQQLDRLGLVSVFDAIDTEAIQPEWEDLWTLYQLVTEQKPKLILEYGSGCSTLILAKAQADSGGGRLISVEASRRWAAHTQSNLPTALKGNVELRVLEPQTRVVGSPALAALGNGGGEWYRHHKPKGRVGVLTIAQPELYELSPDFVYLDGPSPKDVPGYSCPLTGEVYRPIVSDLVFMQDHLPRAFTLVVEGRRHNCAFLREALTIPLTVEVREHQRMTVFRA
jgi:hypothetical protein